VTGTAAHSIRQFPLHFPSRASPCAFTFQLDSNPGNQGNRAYVSSNQRSNSVPRFACQVFDTFVRLETNEEYVARFKEESLVINFLPDPSRGNLVVT
jgi:hypothetical protein